MAVTFDGSLDASRKAGFGGGATVRKSALSPLARSSLDQQIDVLRLAMLGEPSSRELWIGFERECPAEARLAADCVGIIKAENRAAEKETGKVLAKAAGSKAARRARKLEKRLASGRCEPAFGSGPGVSLPGAQPQGQRQQPRPPGPAVAKAARTLAEQRTGTLGSYVLAGLMDLHDPAARARAEAACGPESLAAYQAALLRADPIRRAVAERHGITLDQLTGGGG